MSFVGRGQQSFQGFDPGSLGGLALWLDAADGNTLTLSGSTVAGVRDKSPNSIAMTVSGTRPGYLTTFTNGRPGFAFTGSQWFRASFPSTYTGSTLTVFTVATLNSATAVNGRLVSLSAGTSIDFQASTRAAVIQRDLDKEGIATERGNVTPGTSASVTYDTPTLMGVEYTDTAYGLYTNGTRRATSAASSAFAVGTVGIGYLADYGGTTDTAYWIGNVGEVLIYFATLTLAQRQQVEGYLARKWGLLSSLPAAHLHKSIPPVLRPFSPLDVGGLTLWLDGADATSITLSGSNVTSWADKSGSGNTATGVNLPRWTGSGMLLNGIDQAFTCPNVNYRPCNIFVVAAQTGSGGDLIRKGFGSGSTYEFGVRYNNATTVGYELRTAGGGQLNLTTSLSSTSVPHLIGLTYDNTTANAYLNGALVATGTVTGPIFSGSTVLAIGAISDTGGLLGYFTGTVYEVLIYTTPPTTVQRQQLEAYLATKWGLQSNLGGTSHPFRYGPPMGVSPASTPVAGCSLWLDAADQGTLTFSGSNVTQWRDKSGSGLTFSQATTSNQATYSSNAVVFNGSNWYPSSYSASLSNETTFIVFQYTGSPTDERYLLGGGPTGGAGARSIGFYPNSVSGSIGYSSTGSGWGSISPANSISATRRVLFTGSLSNGSSSLALNGGTTTTPVSLTLSSNQTTMLGVLYYNSALDSPPKAFIGNVHEILCYPSVLTTIQRQQIEGYLAAKWNLTSTLPVDFPYTSGPTDVPVTIPRLICWLDAADPTTVTLSGSNVVQWRDKSTTSNHFNTASGTPTYSSNKLVFTGNTMMQSISNISLTTNTYMIVVHKNSAALSNISMVVSYPSITPFSAAGDVSIRIFQGVLVGGEGGPQPTDFGSYYVNGFSSPAFAPSVYSNITIIAGQSGTTGSSPIAISTIMTGRSFVGDIHELIVYSSPPTAAQRQQIEGYLAAKWNLAPSLPSDHLYKTIAPSLVPAATVPATISGLSLWLDAADRSTLALSGSNVTAWADKSGRGLVAVNNGSNTTARVQGSTLNGVNVVSFPTLSQLNISNMSIANQNKTIFYVVRANGALNGASNVDRFVMPLNCLTTRGLTTYFSGTGPPYSFACLSVTGVEDYVNFSGSVTISNTPILVSAVTAAGSNVATLYGTSQTLTTNNSPGGFLTSAATYTVGNASYTTPWDLGEMIIYNTALTPAQRQQVEGYLAWKWGLKTLLPGPHPYLTAAPGTIPSPPVTIAGLALWLDAADSNAYTLSGSNVASVIDKSSNAWALGSASGFTLNSTKFNTTYPSFYGTVGSAQLGVNTSFTLPQPLTVYFAGQAVTANSSTFLFDGTTSTRCVIYQGATMFAGGEFTATNVGSVYGGHVISAVYNGSSSSMRLNGITTTGNPGTSGFGGIRISGRNTGNDGYPGHICELLIYAGGHTVAQREQIEGYLATKWGLTSTLPVVHPYKAVAPKAIPPTPVPTAVPGLALWLDAADPAALVVSGSNVTQWIDKSGLGNTGTAVGTPRISTAAFQGRPSMYLNGSSSFRGPISITGTQVTAFGVVQFVSVASGAAVSLGNGSNYDWDSNTRCVPIQIIGGGPYVNRLAQFRYGINGYGDVAVSNTPYLVTSSFTGTAPLFYANGAVQPTLSNITGTFAISAYGVGDGSDNSGNYTTGYIAEVLVYTTVLTDTQRQQIEGYLAWKWGVSSKLPSPTNALAKLYRPLSVPFTPLQLSGCILWLDAADPTVFTGGATWTDKSGTSNHATNGTPGTTAMPTMTTWSNGLTAARFVAGSKNSMKTTNTIPNLNVTHFIVIRITGTSGNDDMILFDSVDGQRRIVAPANFPSTIYAHGNSGAPFNILSVTQSQQFQLCLTIASGSTIGYTNGTLAGSSSTSTSSPSQHYFGTTSGTGGYLTGDIAEIITYDTVLSANQRRQVEGYLAWKWGLLPSLGGTLHPFRYGPALVTPTQFAGCVMWLDAADAATLTLSGSNVSQWNDKSGSGWHISQGTSGNRPVYNSTKKSVYFTGANSTFMENTAINVNLGTASVFLVVDQPPGFNKYYEGILSFRGPITTGTDPGNADSALLDSIEGTSALHGLALGGRYIGYGSTGTSATPYIIQFTTSNGAISPAFNGAPFAGDTFVTPQQTSTRVRLGTSQRGSNYGPSGYYTGNYHELIIYNTALTSAQRQQIEGYLAWKWGIQSSLPTQTHPYAAFKP